jgi:hypothetical protein
MKKMEHIDTKQVELKGWVGKSGIEVKNEGIYYF